MLQQVFHSQKKSLDYEEEKRRRILILSFINNISFDMTWNSRKRTSLIVNHELLSVKKRLGAEKKENFLTLNRHTMEVPKKSNQSIIPNKKKERTVTQRKLPAIKICSGGEKERRFFAQLNIIHFFASFSTSCSFVLRKRISFHGSLKRGIKKIKYLSFCVKINSMELQQQQQLDLTIFHFRLFMNSVARVQYRS